MRIVVFFNSMLFTLGIIAGIGPANTNLIGHAINRNHHYLVSIASFSEVILTLFGCIGFGHEKSRLILTAVNIAGVIYLVYYLFGKLKSLRISKSCNANNQLLTKGNAILTSLTLIWFNPLVYVDTLILIGGASANYYGVQHILFIFGCMCAYCIWKFGIPTAVSRYSQALNTPAVWKALDIATILMVSYVLIKLVGIILHTFNI